ncbi:MAG: hypothetical protein WD670_06715 [Actinomycetota bacterium]
MADSRRRSPLAEPLRGAGYLLALGGVVFLVATLISIASMWLMR